jgi:hypothetical protein
MSFKLTGNLLTIRDNLKTWQAPVALFRAEIENTLILTGKET